MSYGFYQAGYSRPDAGTTFVGARVFSVEDTATSAVTNIITLRHAVTAGAAGIGSGLLFQDDDSAGSAENAARVSGLLTTATNGSEVGALVFEARAAGALTEGLRVVASASRAPSGSNSVPSYSFTADIDTGAYLVSDGVWGIATAGTNRLELSATAADFKGKILLGDGGSVSSPGLAERVDSDTGFFWGAGFIAASVDGAEKIRFGTAEVVINEDSADLDFRVESNNVTNVVLVDAGDDSVNFGAASSPANGTFMAINGPINTPSVGTVGNFIDFNNPSLAEAASGVHARMVGVNIQALALTTSGGGTTTDAASLRVSDAPTGATNNYSFWVDAGVSRFDDSILVGATGVGSGSPTNLVVVGNGTAPGSSPADSVTFYSSDFSAGNTVPSFYCEGTAVLLTGQADSASATRVRVSVNGTAVTLLAI